jgi:hypothetical protein
MNMNMNMILSILYYIPIAGFFPVRRRRRRRIIAEREEKRD